MKRNELPKEPYWDGPLSHPFYSKVVKRILDLLLALILTNMFKKDKFLYQLDAALVIIPLILRLLLIK